MDNRTAAIGLALLGALLLLCGVLTKGWWQGRMNYDPGVVVKVGLLNAELCERQDCTAASFARMFGDEQGGFRAFAKVTFGCGLLGFLALLVAAGYCYAGRWPDWFVAPTSAAVVLSGLSLVAGFVVMLTKPMPLHYAGIDTGPSFWLLGSGAILGVLGSILLARERPTTDPEWDL